MPQIRNPTSEVERALRHKIEELESQIRSLQIAAQDSTHTLPLSPCSDSSTAICGDIRDDMYSFRRALNTNSHGEYILLPVQVLMAPLSMVTGDPVMSLLWAFFKVLEHIQFSTNDVFFKSNKLAKEIVEELSRRLAEYYGESYISRLDHHLQQADILAVQKSVTRFGRNIGISFSTESDWTLLSLMDKVKHFLPEYQTTIDMVSLYFSRRCPGYYNIQKENFERSVSKIISSNDASGSIQFSFTKKTDFAVLSTLLLMIRLVHLSFLDPFKKRAGDAIIEPVICMDVVDVAQELLDKLDITVDSNMEHLQALLLMFRYRMVAPEYDCYTRSSNATNAFSLIAILAKALNLNEDPDHCSVWAGPEKKDDTKNQFLRRLAASMIVYEIHVSAIYGHPLSLSFNDSSSYIPLDMPDSNKDLDSINKLYRRLSPVIFKAHNICELILEPGLTLKIGEALKVATELETLIEAKFVPISEYFSDFDPQNDNAKVQEFTLLLLLKCLLLNLNYSFYIFFHHRGEFDKSSYFARKFYRIAWNDFSFLIKSVIPIFDVFFGPGAYLELMPVLYACNKLQCISCLMRIRFVCTIMDSKKTDAAWCRRMISLKQAMAKLEEQATEFINTLSKVMKCAWWNGKSYQFGISAFTNPKVYEFNPQLKSECVVEFSDEELREWERLLEEIKASFQLYEELFENLINNWGRQYQASVGYDVNSDKGLMEIVQFDKMWRLLDIIRDLQREGRLFECDNGHEKEKWVLDFEVLKEFDLLAQLENGNWDFNNGFDASILNT